MAGLAAYALLVPLLFPDGRPPGPRWRHVVRADLVTIAWIAAFAGLSDSPPQALVVATAVLVAVLIAAGLASAVVRYRRAGATQRVQIRECLFAAWAAFVGFFAISVLAPYEALYALDYALLPLSVGLAMLRYRLYEVDVIIRRTLVYAALVSVLALLYVAVVYGIQAAVRSVSGQSGRLAVTVATLIVAAAFQPLRARIQRAVDHRFYRGRYDAARTLESFSGRLREQVEIEMVSGEVLDVVRQTLQPAHVSLWLRDGGSA